MATEAVRAPSPKGGIARHGSARTHVVRTLRDIAVARARLDRLQAQLEEELDAVRRCREARIAALQGRFDRLLGELQGFCRARRDAILPPGRKTLVTPLGEVGFRKAEPVLRLCAGVGEEDVCRLMRRARLDALLRVRETPDRAAVYKALEEGRLTREQLRRCGLELAGGEERFHFRLREDAGHAPGGSRR